MSTSSSNGVPGSSYTVLTSTNVAAWITNSTGAFAGDGTVTNTIPICPGPAG